jgi:SSS family solute:Na+ symporter
MIGTVLPMSIVLVFIAILFVISYYAQRRGVATSTDYFLAGRKLGHFSVLCGLYKTMTSAFAFMGMVGLAYRAGAGAWCLAVVAAGEIGTIVFIYKRLRPIYKANQFITQADFLCDRFRTRGSRWFRLLIALTGVLTVVIGHFLVQLIASGHVFQQITGGKVPYMFGVIFFVAVIVAYVFMGGLRAIAWTDIFMALVMFASLITIALLILLKLGKNLPDVYRALAVTQPAMMSLPGKLPFFTYPVIVSWVIAYVFSFMFLPQMVMWASSAGSDRVLTFVATGWMPISALGHFLTTAVIGVSAALLFVTLPKGVAPDALTPFLAYALSPSPHIVAPILMSGLFAASLATAGAALLAMGTIVTKDIVVEVFGLKRTDRQVRNISRIVIVCIGLVGIPLAYAPQNMIAVIMTASLGLISVLVIPYIFGLFWKRANAPGTITGIITGLVVLIWLTYIPVLGGGVGYAASSFLGLQCLVWAMAAQLVVTFLITYLTPPPPEEIVQRYFSG